jgi:hypothetical protein
LRKNKVVESPLTTVKMSPLKGTQSGRTTDNEQPRNHPIRSYATIEGQAINPKRGSWDAKDKHPANQTFVQGL